MKSFDDRLQNDLFPKKTAAFDRTVKKQLEKVCSQSEETQGKVIRFPGSESDHKPVRKNANIFGRIGIVAAAAVLVICTLAVGTLAVLAGRQKAAPAAPDVVQPTATAETVPMNTVYAATVDEFLAAIASNTKIILTGSVYNLSAAYEHDGNKHMWREVEDGYELVLCNLENFQIVGSENTVIETDPRYADVLGAEYCTGLVFSNLTVGHTKKSEKCSGEVIRLTHCTDTRLENCKLYGCGSWGITAWYSKNLTVADSEIYECSSGALHIWECAGVAVTESTIRNCGGGGTLADLIYIQDSDVSVLNCDIYENTTESSLIYVGYDGTAEHRISLVGTDVHDNTITHRSNFLLNYHNSDETVRMTVSGCAFTNNGDNPILPGNSRVYDADGNELGDADLAAMTLKRDNMPKPGGTDACGTLNAATPAPSDQTASTEGPAVRKTVYVSTAEEFFAAIAPNTEIVLAAGTYDLGMSAEPFTNGNPYCSFATRYITDGDRFFKITGVDGLCIRAEEGAECVLHALHKDACEAVLAAESCSGMVLSGITVCGNAENDIMLLQCSEVSIEGCELSVDGYKEFSETPNGIGLFDCSNVKVSNSRIPGCTSAIYAMDSKSITVSGCELTNCFCATWMSNADDVLFTDCSVHDCRNEDPLPGDSEQGDASYLIQITGQSSSVLTATFEDCDLYNNKATFFFSSDGIDAVTLSGLKIHDSGFDRLFDFDETAEPAGSHEIVNCDIDRNKIGDFLFCGLSETRVSLSGTSIVDNEIETVFFGGDVTVSGCAFASPDVTYWIGSHESYPDLRTFVHDTDGSELGEAELSAMTLKRNNP